MAITMELPGMEMDTDDMLAEKEAPEAPAEVPAEEVSQEVADDSPGPLVNDEAIADHPQDETEQLIDTANEAFPGKTSEQIARMCWKASLSASKDAYIETAMERKRLADELKAAKEEEKEALEEVQRLIDMGWQPFMRKEDSPQISGQGGEGAGDAPVSSVDPPDTALASGGSVDWKAVSIDELGLAGKFIDKLKDADAGTMGGLEDLRVRVAAGTGSWPQGVGPKKIEAITDRLLPWLSKHRDAAEFEGVNRTPLETEEPATEEPAGIGQGGEVEPADGDADEEKKLAARFNQLNTCGGPLLCSGKKYAGHLLDRPQRGTRQLVARLVAEDQGDSGGRVTDRMNCQ